MLDLNETRNKIDIVDRELVSLFEKRMDLVKEVTNYKIENGMNILDSGREEFILEKNMAFLSNKKYEKYLDKLYISIMNISKEMQIDIMENSNND